MNELFELLYKNPSYHLKTDRCPTHYGECLRVAFKNHERSIVLHFRLQELSSADDSLQLIVDTLIDEIKGVVE